ncbi:hypothetical protein_gp129 [Bacillus phage vB_BceM_WH1]|nr:hypothetical protein_gp129 [Bacillus phage vB_BceM_WH1]
MGLRTFIQDVKEVVMANIEAQGLRLVKNYVVEGVTIHHDNVGMKASGLLIAACTKGENGPMIYVDDLFFQLSKNAQKFVVQHELGHARLHQNKRFLKLRNTVELSTRWIRSSFYYVSKAEQEADMYAMVKVGDQEAKAALREIFFVLTTMKGIYNREVLLRYFMIPSIDEEFKNGRILSTNERWAYAVEQVKDFEKQVDKERKSLRK